MIVVLDPAPAPSAPLPEELYGLIDVITPNETEAEVFLGFRPRTVDEARRAARELVARGARAASSPWVRAAPSWRRRRDAENGDENGARPSAFAVTPVSTVAAGDCFNAGLAVALCEGKDLREAARFACACGALW